MIDYYPALLRAVQSTESAVDQEGRRAVYVQAWQLLTEQWRARHPPISADELQAHRSAFQAAVERIERAASQAAAARAPRMRAPVPDAPDAAGAPPAKASVRSGRPPARDRWVLWAAGAAAVAVVAVGVGGYVAWTALTRKVAPAAAAVEPANREPVSRRTRASADSTADLAPGIDGGSSDADLALIYRRQRVFYRTTLPPGTIVVDKLQHFAYLVLPNSVAVRYGIGVGASCAQITGLRRVARKAEWPPWTPPGSKANPMPGGPGNPLGARLLDLDDNISRIHGTNAPRTIGEDVERGCVRLVNDDVTDLYDRAPVGTRVVLR